jgi:hypothetical protein
LKTDAIRLHVLKLDTLPIGINKFAQVFASVWLQYSSLAGGMGAPLRTGFFVQQSVVDRL